MFYSAVAEGIPADHPHLVLLFFMCQLFLRELAKCSRLVQLVPMDMTGYFGKIVLNIKNGFSYINLYLCKSFNKPLMYIFFK